MGTRQGRARQRGAAVLTGAVLALLGSAFLGSAPAQALPAEKLPNADQAQEQAMTRVKVGKPFLIDTPVGDVRVKIIRLTPVPRKDGVSEALRMTVLVQNLSRSTANGMSVRLRCDSTAELGYNYIGTSGDVSVQYLPPRTQQRGRLTVHWPDKLVSGAKPCTNPRLWLVPAFGWSDYTAHPGAAGRLALDPRLWR